VSGRQCAKWNWPRSYTMIVIAPLNAPQVYVPPLNGVEHPLAPEVMNAMLRYGSRPISLWTIVNSLANARNPACRAQRRSWRLRYLCACRELLKFKVIYRHGGHIATSNFAPRPRAKSPRRLPPSVGRSASGNGGSNVTAVPVETAATRTQAPENEVVVASRNTVKATQESKSAPAPYIVSAAASALARLPRRPKRSWSGWIGSTRSYCGMPIRLPTGEAVFAFGALRGRVIWSREPGVLTDGVDGARIHWGVLPADRVTVVASDAARLLGSRKRGVRERRSVLKIASARLNGRLPPRPDSRPRGRPKRG
jgi:hypothetical protein